MVMMIMIRPAEASGSRPRPAELNFTTTTTKTLYLNLLKPFFFGRTSYPLHRFTRRGVARPRGPSLVAEAGLLRGGGHGAARRAVDALGGGCRSGTRRRGGNVFGGFRRFTGDLTQRGQIAK